MSRVKMAGRRGSLPFIGLSAVAAFGDGPRQARAVPALVACSAVILSFAGGV